MTSPYADTTGLGWYGDPDDADTWQHVDPLIKPACQRICESGWVWTAESCQGHPDCTDDLGPWANNTRPMMRLVCRNEHVGAMVNCLFRAIVLHSDVTMATRLSSPDGFEAWPHRTATHTAVLIYLPAVSVGQRDAGLRVYERFAEFVCAEDHAVHAVRPNEG